MANTITIDILADTRKLVQGVNTANQQLSGLQKSISKVGNITAAAGAFAVAGNQLAQIGRQVGDAVKASIDLADSVDAVKMTLKDPAAFKDFQSFLKTTSTSLGLSQKNAAGFGAQLAGIGYGAGIGGKELEKFTEKTLQIAVDLRSKFGGSLEEALTAVKSGLTGEMTPLKKYGIALSDVSMKQYALSKGLIKTTKGALTPQQKTMIAYTMLLDGKVNGSVGNFADTQGSAANQLQMFNAQLEDAKTSLGNAFLPGLTKVVTFINKEVIPAFQALPDPIKAFIGVAVGLGVVAGPVVLAAAAFGALGISLGTVAAAVWAVAAPVLAVIAVIALLVAAGVLIYQNWDKIVPFFQGIWDKVTGFFSNAWNKIKEVLGNMWEGISGFFGDIIENVTGFAKKLWDDILDPLFDLLIGIVVVLIALFVKPFIELWDLIKEPVTKAITFIVDKVKSLGGLIGDAIKTAISFAKEKASQFLELGKKIFEKIKEPLKDIASFFINIGKNVASAIWTGVSEKVTWLRDKFYKFFGGLIPDWVKKILNIKSPSKVFIDIGNQIVRGLAIGMDPKGIRSASTGLAMGAVSGFGPAQLAGTGGMRGGIVVNINAGLGTDPYELGRVVSQALNKYESINGTR